MRIQRLYSQLTYTGKHTQKAKRRRRRHPQRWGLRSLATAGVALCLLVAICGGTYSYFSGKDKVVNQLEISELDFVIEEPSWEDPDTPVRPGDVLPKDPQIVNTGEMPFVVRVKIQEVWTPKTAGNGQNDLINPNYVRFFAADSEKPAANTNFSAQQLLNILAADSQQTEESKNFALRLNLTPNQSNNLSFGLDTGAITDMWTIAGGWYRGSGVDSEWLYYNQIVPVTGRTEPVFRAVTIRTAEDIYALEDIVLADSTLTGDAYSQALEQAYADQLAAYNDLLTQYDLDIYVYAETVQAESFAWQDAWGADLPTGWENTWGGST